MSPQFVFALLRLVDTKIKKAVKCLALASQQINNLELIDLEGGERVCLKSRLNESIGLK